MLRRLEFLVAQEVLVVVALHRRIAGFLEVPPGLTALLRSIAAYLGFRASAKIVKRTRKITAKDGLRQRGFTAFVWLYKTKTGCPRLTIT